MYFIHNRKYITYYSMAWASTSAVYYIYKRPLIYYKIFKRDRKPQDDIITI